MGSSKRALMIIKISSVVSRKWSTYTGSMGWERILPLKNLWTNYDYFFLSIKLYDINSQACEKSHKKSMLCKIAQVYINRSVYSINYVAWVSMTTALESKRREKERAHNSKVEPPFAVLVAATSSKALLFLFVCLFVYVPIRRLTNFYLPPLLTMQRL